MNAHDWNVTEFNVYVDRRCRLNTYITYWLKHFPNNNVLMQPKQTRSISENIDLVSAHSYFITSV